MNTKGQILFLTVVTSLILAILVIGVYANSMKQLRHLENRVQATWGDVEWRLEERNQFLPKFIKSAKHQVDSPSDLYKTVNDGRINLAKVMKEGGRSNVLNAAKQLDESLRFLLTHIDQSVEEDIKESFFVKREELFDLNSRLVLERREYETAVIDLKKFTHGLPGRWIAPSYMFQETFFDGKSTEPKKG